MCWSTCVVFGDKHIDTTWLCTVRSISYDPIWALVPSWGKSNGICSGGCVLEKYFKEPFLKDFRVPKPALAAAICRFLGPSLWNFPAGIAIWKTIICGSAKPLREATGTSSVQNWYISTVCGANGVGSFVSQGHVLAGLQSNSIFITIKNVVRLWPFPLTDFCKLSGTAGTYQRGKM